MFCIHVRHNQSDSIYLIALLFKLLLDWFRGLSWLIEPLLYMLERVFKVNCWAPNLQVDQAIPDLFSLFVREYTHAISPRLVPRDILEDIVVPEDRVFHILLVSQSSYCTTILLICEFEDVSLNLHINIVIEETLSSHFFLH